MKKLKLIAPCLRLITLFESFFEIFLITPSLHKIKVFRKKDYHVIIPDYDFTSNILSNDSLYFAEVVM